MLSKLGFGRTPSAAKEAGSSPADQAALERQYLTQNRELVRVAVRGTLKEHGLDATWVGCSVLPAPPPEPGRAPSPTLWRSA